jgi:hypothetical protein
VEGRGVSALEPSMAFTADKGWHLTGGLAEQIVSERDEARRQRDQFRLRAERKGETMNLDEAIESLCDEAESLGLAKQAEKFQAAFDQLRADIAAQSERAEALEAVAVAEEALRVARERAGLPASPQGSRKGLKLNLTPEDRERRRQQAYAMQEARKAKLAERRVSVA